MLNNNITKITTDELMNVFGFSPAGSVAVSNIVDIKKLKMRK